MAGPPQQVNHHNDASIGFENGIYPLKNGGQLIHDIFCFSVQYYPRVCDKYSKEIIFLFE